MKTTKKVISLILAVALVVSMFTVAAVSVSAATNPYSDAAMALDAEYAYDGELGAIYSPEATVFKVWAPLCDEAVDETGLGDKVTKRNKRNKQAFGPQASAAISSTPTTPTPSPTPITSMTAKTPLLMRHRISTPMLSA